MNRYDQFFDFRMATVDDIDAIMHFIKEYWDCNHILANSREFFEYHYGDTKGGVNVFLMCKKKGEIVGMIGFVQYSSKPEMKYVTASITKVINNLSVPMCGIELMKRFHEHMAPFVEFGCGANPQTILPIYRNVFKYHTGKLNQYYIINSEIKNFKIITIPDQAMGEIEYCSDEQYEIIRIENIDDIDFDYERKYDNLPYKDKAFLNKRYFNHPVYRYDIYGIRSGQKYEGVIFTRKINYNGSSIILIVDFIGDIDCFGKIGEGLRRILAEENAECISLLEVGISNDILAQSGFSLINDEEVIIPTYFEPFVNINVSNYYQSMEENLIIFKATGDQDNPKHINNVSLEQ